ncbi:hypothetical protein [Pontibacter litorisediminis]|uniref:hypothetical protein n=1 Tax=Pontibacter litorisediminis TaxID=1846260 RepID=UPI0023EBEF5B|nr:hypothetical protein [Pontibacter litorisediminis]
MSELNNPLFDNEREFLERQKEEYKRALMGDVDQIKSQGQEIGKKVAIAGGVLFAGWLLRRAFSGGGKKKDKAGKRGKKQKHEPHGTFVAAAYPSHYTSTPYIDYDSYVHEQEDSYTLASEQMPRATPAGDVKKKSEPFLSPKLSKALQQQVLALLMMYATKKLEEYLNSVSENNDIAAKPTTAEPVVAVTEIETTEYIVPEKDAI